MTFNIDKTPMTVERYTDPAAFLDRTHAQLERDEAANNLLIGIIGRLCADIGAYDDQPPYLAVVEDETLGDPLAAIAVMTPPYSLIIHCEPGQEDNALPLLAVDLEESEWAVAGVNAPVELAETFAAIWTEHNDCSSRVEMHLRTFELRRVEHPRYSSGHLRAAKPGELALVVDWVRAFIHEALGDSEPFDLERTRRRYGEAINDGSIFVWDDKGPVSMAGTGRQTTHGINIGMVYTPPALRGHGYASSSVATLCQKLLDDGWDFCTLFTDLANPTSNAIYQRIGFRPICDFVHLKFE